MSKPFRPNPDFIPSLKRQPTVRDALKSAASSVARTANRIERGKFMARRGRRPGQAIIVDATSDEVRVVNTKHGGHLQEWGSVNNAPQAPLRRAVRANGLRFRERPKP